MYQILVSDLGFLLMGTGAILGTVLSMNFLWAYSGLASLRSTDYTFGKTALIFESEKEVKGKKRSLLVPLLLMIVGFFLMHH